MEIHPFPHRSHFIGKKLLQPVYSKNHMISTQRKDQSISLKGVALNPPAKTSNSLSTQQRLAMAIGHLDLYRFNVHHSVRDLIHQAEIEKCVRATNIKKLLLQLISSQCSEFDRFLFLHSKNCIQRNKNIIRVVH